MYLAHQGKNLIAVADAFKSDFWRLAAQIPAAALGGVEGDGGEGATAEHIELGIGQNGQDLRAFPGQRDIGGDDRVAVGQRIVGNAAQISGFQDVDEIGRASCRERVLVAV